MKNNYILSDWQCLVLSDWQCLLPGRYTTFHLLNVLDKLTVALDNGLHADVVYCDFIKAFYQVPRKRLLGISQSSCQSYQLGQRFSQ